MKRRALKLVVFLLLGAIINVAVAWACVTYFASAYWDTIMGWSDSVEIVRIETSTAWNRHEVWLGDLPVEEEFSYGFGVSHSKYPGEMFDSGAAHGFSYTSGWPNPALWGAYAVRDDTDTWYWSVDFGRTNTGFGVGILPLLPLFPGFAINTIFYAAIGWFMVAASGAVRQRVRIKRSQCAACGYDLRGSASDQCPECGEALPAFNRPGRAADLANSSACMIETIRM